MTQDRYLGRRITDRQTAEVLEDMFRPADAGNSTKRRRESGLARVQLLWPACLWA